MTREDLARDLESVADGQQRDLSVLITRARDKSYSDELLVRDLSKASLAFFAKKLQSGGYSDTEETPEQ